MHMFIDATFKCVPRGFYQNLIGMGYFRAYDYYGPVFYILMQKKTSIAYRHAIYLLMSVTGFRLELLSLCCDFEWALMKSMLEHMIHGKASKAFLVGCLFHWKQCLRRKMLELHIPALFVHEVMKEGGPMELLTVIPVIEILAKGLPYVKEKVSQIPFAGLHAEKLEKFFRYFEKTFCSDGAKYQYPLWNISGTIDSTTEESILINRTNNPLERFNRHLNDAFSTPHPTMIEFVSTIRRLSLECLRTLQLIKQNRSNRPVHQPVTIPKIPAEYVTFIASV